jgi:hypothetical protein
MHSLLACYRLFAVVKHSEIRIESSPPPPPVIIVVVENSNDAAAYNNNHKNGSGNNNVTCGVTVVWGLDWMFGFIALIHPTHNCK